MSTTLLIVCLLLGVLGFMALALLLAMLVTAKWGDEQQEQTLEAELELLVCEQERKRRFAAYTQAPRFPRRLP